MIYIFTNLMKKNTELKYNIIVSLLLILVDFGWGIFIKNKTELPLVFLLTTTYSISFFTVYFLNYFYVLPKFLKTKKYVWLGISFIVLLLVFAGIRFFLEEVISLHLFNIHNYNLDQENILFIYLLDSFIFAFKAFLYSSVVYLLFRNNENKTAIHDLKLAHEKAQLSSLKSQLSPHFLFNTLNNFYIELYDEKPETAEGILKLSQLLRYITYETTDDFVFLEKEIQFIKDYIYFFERRYEDNLHLKLEINGIINTQKIPSLILIHFIENVCKHGIINNAEKPAKINIDIKESSLEISTKNYVNTSEKYMEKGIGTKNIKQRLDVIFKNNYTLTQEKNDTIFSSFLKIPL